MIDDKTLNGWESEYKQARVLWKRGTGIDFPEGHPTRCCLELIQVLRKERKVRLVLEGALRDFSRDHLRGWRAKEALAEVTNILGDKE